MKTKWLGMLMVVILQGQMTNALFCSAHCLNSMAACTNELATGCSATVSTIYSSVYSLNALTVLDYNEDASAITAANNYISSNFTAISCVVLYPAIPLTATYYMPSGFNCNDYLYKMYLLGTNHYQINIRFKVAFIGVWAPTDYLLFTVNDTLSVQNYRYPYNCTVTETLCTGKVGNNVDCFNVYEYDLQHNTTVLALNFSALTLIQDLRIQFWSVNEILVASLRCDPSCVICFGPTSTQCGSCASNMFLLGNTCVTNCPFFVMPYSNTASNGSCVQTCPQGFYPTAIVSNSSCLPCSVGCTSCTSSTVCNALVSATANPANLFYDYLALWIIVIVAALIIFFAIIYRLCIYRQPQIKVSSLRNQVTLQSEDKLTIKDKSNIIDFHVETFDFEDHVRALDYEDHIKSFNYEDHIKAIDYEDHVRNGDNRAQREFKNKIKK